MAAIQRFKDAIRDLQLDEEVTAKIMEGYETITDGAKKETRAAFFKQAVERMDALLDEETRRDLRDACACSKGGWRLKAVQKVTAVVSSALESSSKEPCRFIYEIV